MEWGLGQRPTMQNPVGQLADRWVLQKKKGTRMSAYFLFRCYFTCCVIDSE